MHSQPQRDLYAEVQKIAIVLLIVVVISTVFVVAIYATQFHAEHLSGEPANWGVLGDYLGGTLGPILNLTTIAILVISISFQRKQIEDGKLESQENKVHAQKQYEALIKQNFEQTFFAWLKSYQDIVQGIAVERPSRMALNAPPIELRGRDALFQIWGRAFSPSNICDTTRKRQGDAQKEIVAKNLHELEHDRVFDHDVLRSAILAHYAECSANPFYYFDAVTKALSQLIKWVGHSDNSFSEKLMYLSIIKSQISSTELSLLFLHGLEEQNESLRALFNQFSFLDGLPSVNWFAPLRSSEIPGSYKASAFEYL